MMWRQGEKERIPIKNPKAIVFWWRMGHVPGVKARIIEAKKERTSENILHAPAITAVTGIICPLWNRQQRVSLLFGQDLVNWKGWTD
ncbi:hypothetical protein CDAR_55201 [Caerostris darwini]|uniref:Uncharacterized protein n=1 Tax=Caerostris darwini TaxID=1538125 RepID=A0AAV4PDN2_9ARAC|nr:hypothetical protein CDAR_55201 [Caerostris darwini]